MLQATQKQYFIHVCTFIILSGYQYISNGQTLVIGSVQKSNEGSFTCRADNVAGTANDSIEIIIHG